MTTQRRGPGDDWVPDACTLPTADRPLRVADFDALFARSLRDVQRLGTTSARLLLDRSPGLAERVRELVAAETTCCSFFTFAVAETDPGTVTLDVTVPTAYVDVLEALTTRAATSR